MMLKELVFAHMDLFFSHVGTEGLDVASAIAETARGNRALAAQVQETGRLLDCYSFAAWIDYLSSQFSGHLFSRLLSSGSSPNG